MRRLVILMETEDDVVVETQKGNKQAVLRVNKLNFVIFVKRGGFDSIVVQSKRSLSAYVGNVLRQWLRERG